jgi:hypothetical protein
VRARSALLFAAALLVSCELPDPAPYDAGSGPVCYDDTECAPNACCGEGTAVVHKSQAPDCTTVKCSGACPINGIKCGCAVPVCRNQRCTSAISPMTGC